MKKKEKTEKELQFEAKLDELEKKEKATRKENKVKYGPGRRGTLVLVTASLCVVIAGLGVYYVQQLLKDDKYSSGNEVVTTSATTTTVMSVPTGGGTTSPVEVYPDDADTDSANSNSPDELLDGGFEYKPIEVPETSATTTVVPHDVQVTTKSDDFFTGGMGGDYYFDDPADTDSRPSDVTISSTSNARPEQTTANVTTPATTATVASTTPSTVITTNVTTSVSTYPRPPVGTMKPIDPESTYGYNAHDYLN